MRADWRHASRHFTTVISCKNQERLHFLTHAYADICQCLLHIKWWETRGKKKMRVHKQVAFAKGVAKWIRKEKITREVRLLHWSSYCVFYRRRVEINRAFPGTKLVFLCINYGYGLFIRLSSPQPHKAATPLVEAICCSQCLSLTS